MKTKSLILFVLAILLSLSVDAQVVVAHSPSVVPDLQKTTKRKPVKTKLKKGQSKDLNFFVFANNVYTFELDIPNKLKKVNFVLINEQGDIIFDNAIAGFCAAAVLYADISQRVTLKITTQPPKFFELNKKYFEVGVKLSYKRNTTS